MVECGTGVAEIFHRNGTTGINVVHVQAIGAAIRTLQSDYRVHGNCKDEGEKLHGLKADVGMNSWLDAN